MGDLDFLGSVGLGVVNSGLSWLGSGFQNKSARENLDYAMDRYYSPRAQVNNLAAAGLNPAVAMGNQSPVFSGSAPMSMPDAPQFGIGTSSLSDIGNYIKSLAEAKKAGVDTEKSLAETDAIKLQNDLTEQFGQKSWILDLAQKYQNILLAQKTNDIKEQEKAINEYKKTSEKILSETKGIEKSMLEKRLGNIDTEIRLSNKLQEEKINTEKSQQGALAASARYSNSLADTEDGLRELKKASQIILNGIEAVKYEEDSKTLQFKIDKLAAEVGIAKWTAILQEVEARDKNAYNAIQRLIMGKSVKGDASTIIQALSNYEKFTFKH